MEMEVNIAWIVVISRSHRILVSLKATNRKLLQVLKESCFLNKQCEASFS